MTSIVREFLRAMRPEDFPKALHTYRSAFRHPLGIPRTLTQRDLRTAGAVPSRTQATPRSQRRTMSASPNSVFRPSPTNGRN